mgnify:CR=1 FL=1
MQGLRRIADIYRALGDALKRAVPDWRASILCGSAELAHATGLRARKTYQVFNGAIECTLIDVERRYIAVSPRVTSSSGSSNAVTGKYISPRISTMAGGSSTASRRGMPCTVRTFDVMSSPMRPSLTRLSTHNAAAWRRLASC